MGHSACSRLFVFQLFILPNQLSTSETRFHRSISKSGRCNSFSHCCDIDLRSFQQKCMRTCVFTFRRCRKMQWKFTNLWVRDGKRIKLHGILCLSFIIKLYDLLFPNQDLRFLSRNSGPLTVNVRTVWIRFQKLQTGRGVGRMAATLGLSSSVMTATKSFLKLVNWKPTSLCVYSLHDSAHLFGWTRAELSRPSGDVPFCPKDVSRSHQSTENSRSGMTWQLSTDSFVQNARAETETF